MNKNHISEKDFPILILVVVNMIVFLMWIFFYSVYHEYIRHFMFDILGLPFYPRVITMFLIYFSIAIPVSIIFYLFISFFKTRKKI